MPPVKQGSCQPEGVSTPVEEGSQALLVPMVPLDMGCWGPGWDMGTSGGHVPATELSVRHRRRLHPGGLGGGLSVGDGAWGMMVRCDPPVITMLPG